MTVNEKSQNILSQYQSDVNQIRRLMSEIQQISLS